MRFSNDSLQKLEKSVSERLSEKRFRHTLGVVDAASFIGGYLSGLDMSEVRAAALLHDIAKEIPADEAAAHLAALSLTLKADIVCEAVHHSLIAPLIIQRDFPEFATEGIISAVKYHTTGSPDMSVLDEVIFISDYVEEGRRYNACTRLRESLYSALKGSRDYDEALSHLNDAVIKCLDDTIVHIIGRNKYLHERTVSTRNAFLARRPMPLNL